MLFCSHRGDSAKLLNNFWQNFENVVNVFVGVQLAQRKAQGAVCILASAR